MRRLIAYRLCLRPLQALRLLRRLARNMPLRDVLYLLVKPFLARKPGATRSKALVRAVDDQQKQQAATNLTPLNDEALEAEILGRQG